MNEDLWQRMNLIAAAAHPSIVDMNEDDMLEASRMIVNHAPEHIRDDFKKCCAYHIYRAVLIEANKNNDVGQVLNAQMQLMQFIERN